MFQEETGGRRRATFLVLLTPKFAKAKNKFVKAFLKSISKDFEKLMKSLEFFFNNSLIKLFVDMVAGAKGGWQTPATCFALIHIGLTIWLHECMQD